MKQTMSTTRKTKKKKRQIKEKSKPADPNQNNKTLTDSQFDSKPIGHLAALVLVSVVIRTELDNR
jgi:hypothetical protein